MAVCALAAAPLVTIHPAHVINCLYVRPCLEAPLHLRLDRRELTSLALVADASAERAEKVKGAMFSQQKTVARIEAICHMHRPGQKTSDTLAELGILSLVPYLEQRLSPCQHYHEQPQQQQPTAASQSPGGAYLNYVSLLNQAVMMSTQLYNDATNPAHHKYAAHQVALLYQSLNMLQGETKPIRRHIEARFDEIKAITESPHPFLDMELSSWLQTVTWVCRQEVIVCPGYIHRRLHPMLEATRG